MTIIQVYVEKKMLVLHRMSLEFSRVLDSAWNCIQVMQKIWHSEHRVAVPQSTNANGPSRHPYLQASQCHHQAQASNVNGKRQQKPRVKPRCFGRTELAELIFDSRKRTRYPP